MEKKEEYEDTTKYGEFIPTHEHWVSLDEQRSIVERLENITKKK